MRLAGQTDGRDKNWPQHKEAMIGKGRVDKCRNTLVTLILLSWTCDEDTSITAEVAMLLVM